MRESPAHEQENLPLSEEVAQLMEEQQPYLDSEWKRLHTQILIEQYRRRGEQFYLEDDTLLLPDSAEVQDIIQGTLTEAGYERRCSGRLKTLVKGSRHKIAIDTATQLLSHGLEMAMSSERDPELLHHEVEQIGMISQGNTVSRVFESLNQWIGHPERQYLFVNEQKALSTKMSREYSISQRLSALLYQSQIIYRRLTNEEDLPEGLDSLRLAFTIVLRSKAYTPGEHLTTYPIILNAFNLWDFETHHYPVKGLLEGKISNVTDYIREKVQLVHAFHNISPELRSTLENTCIYGTPLTYMNIFRCHTGINPEQKRELYSEIVKEYASREKLVRVLKKIRDAILNNDPSILEGLVHSKKAKTAQSPLPSFAVGAREFVVDRRGRRADEHASQLEKMIADGSWRNQYLMIGEILCDYETLRTYADTADRLVRAGDPAVSRRAHRQTAEHLNQRLAATTVQHQAPEDVSKNISSIGSLFPEQIHEAFPHTSLGLSDATIGSIVGELTGMTSTQSSRLNEGLCLINRYKALGILREIQTLPEQQTMPDPQYLLRRVQRPALAFMGYHTQEEYRNALNANPYLLTSGTELKGPKDIAEELTAEIRGFMSPYNPTTISVLGAYTIWEALCSGIMTDESLQTMARAFRMPKSEVAALAITDHDPDYLTKVRSIINLYKRKLRVKGPSSRPGTKTYKMLALTAAVESIPLNQQFMLTQLLLFAIVRGHTPTNFLDPILKRKVTIKERQTITEMTRHLLQSPRRFHKKER